MMKLLRKHQATLIRFDGDGYWDEATEDWVKGGTTSSPLVCNVQPQFSQGIEQKKLPEGIRQKDVREIRTTTELLESSEKDGINADVITFQGIDYEVFEVREWLAGCKLSHYEATVIRKDKLDAIS